MKKVDIALFVEAAASFSLIILFESLDTLWSNYPFYGM